MSIPNPYFVMIHCNDHEAQPAINVNDEVQFYPSIEAARLAVQNNIFAQSLGYEIFCLGEGEL